MINVLATVLLVVGVIVLIMGIGVSVDTYTDHKGRERQSPFGLLGLGSMMILLAFVLYNQ